MARNGNALLTIAIPTFNRSKFLDRALATITAQLPYCQEQIQIMISYNCSTDDTSLVVQKYINANAPIKYFKNELNKGADFNIRQCYILPETEYILVFGDDDVLEPNSLQVILNTINQYPNFGIYHLSWRALTASKKQGNIHEVFFYDDSVQFIKKISHNITFISANVINRKYLPGFSTDEFLKSNLVQLPLLLQIFFCAEYNLVQVLPLVAVEPDNSGGYSVCKTFGENLNMILSHFINNNATDKQSKKVAYIIKTRILMEAFPGWIFRIKTRNNTFSDDINIHKSLSRVYGHYLHYWLFDYPLMILSAGVLNIIWPVYRVYAALLRRILKVNFKKNEIKRIGEYV
jgi:glycosyltransferase involved in cell wall biosynthesis